jgi:hypothetical protein
VFRVEDPVGSHHLATQPVAHQQMVAIRVETVALEALVRGLRASVHLADEDAPAQPHRLGYARAVTGNLRDEAPIRLIGSGTANRLTGVRIHLPHLHDRLSAPSRAIGPGRTHVFHRLNESLLTPPG